MERKLKHLAIILDGNRRYAKSRDMASYRGHGFGAEVVDSLLEWIKELEIKELTLYTLSIENLNRDKKELEVLFRLFEKYFKKFKKDKRIHSDRVRIRFIGDLSLVPEKLRRLAGELEELTKDYDNYKLNFCFAYGGRQELVDVFNRLKDKEKITEEDISQNLLLNSEPDLIIRTGNRTRTSNFLTWQSAYSEWVFLEKMWPEFTKQDLIRCLNHFESVQRTFGR